MDSGLGFVEKAQKVILHPSEFFDGIRSERGIGQAFKYLAILALVNVVASTVLLVAFPEAPQNEIFKASESIGIPAPLFVIPLAGYAAALVFTFIGVGLEHLSVKLLGGKGDYAATYKALVYASTLSMLLGWIPIVSIITGLYSFYLSLKGLSKLHDFSMWRAFVAAFLVPLVIGVVLSVVLAGIAYMYISSIFNSAIPLT